MTSWFSESIPVTGEPVKEIPEDIEAMKNLDETIKSHDEKNKIAESSSPLPETDTRGKHSYLLFWLHSLF